MKVTIKIKNGMVIVQDLPKGVTLEIMDYDIECNQDRVLEVDTFGDQFMKSVFKVN